MSPADFLTDQNAFEKRIKSLEEEARGKYLSAIQAIPKVELSDWFIRLLENRIIPALRQIGIDDSFGWLFFKMAAPAWESMGPITDKEVWFHPIVIKNIEEIRNGILSKEQRGSESLSLLIGMPPQDLHSFVKERMYPESLVLLLNDISTSWIILPRVYDHLEEHHSQYLLGYLKYLDNETNPEFRKILSRITIEFVGNYTLKYISDIHPKGQMIDALFYGYAAMFWRNLRSPPNGFEDGLICKHFLYWMKSFQKRFGSINNDMARTIKDMEVEREKAFPVFNTFGLARDSHEDTGRFLITLRHGHQGIKAVIKYLGIGGALLKDMTDGCIAYEAVPKALIVLLREIKKRYPIESPKTKEFIREFLMKLRADYDLKRINSVSTRAELSEQLRFVGPRVLGLIHDLTRSIH